MDIYETLKMFKNTIEEAIKKDGEIGKTSLIRSSVLINLLHDAVKNEFISLGINQYNIFPPYGESRPELKLAGFLKQKDQDICIIPSNIPKKATKIIWGPMKSSNLVDEYGEEFTTNTLVINVRSQMSSIAKNTDTLFERTFAEPLNLHMIYPNIVLGEVYLIPVYEYDESMIKQKKIGFCSNHVNLEKYISFFNEINNRKDDCDERYKYERCALLIVDFSKKDPYLYKNSKELKDHKLISEDFDIEYESLNFQDFARDILDIYSKRYNIRNIQN